MKKLILILLLVTVILAGCTASNTTTNSGDNNPPVVGETKTFTMTAKMFEFVPGTITVNEGDTVVLNITSEDVEHGISIPQFGVSETLPVGEMVTVQFVADEAGTYTFFCNVFCGSGHQSMKGTLVVNP